MTRSPKRVLVFSTAYLPHVGGAEIAIREITQRLSGEYVFDLVCARFERGLPSKEVMGAITVYRKGVGIRALDKLILPFAALMHALSHRYELYWAMMVTYGSMGAYLAHLVTRVPVILTLQEGDPREYLRGKWLGLVGLSWRLALSMSASVTAISSYLASLAKEFGYKGTPVIIPNGVDLSQFGNTPVMPHEGTKLITTSRLVHKNAVDDVLHALVLLPDEISFDIYGTGPEEEKLRTLTHTLGLTERVRFHGHVAYEELPVKLAQADIFIRPSRSEGMGNSFIEAMAAGLPVIATQEGGIRDFLFDALRNPTVEPTGYAVDVDSPEQIAQAVQRVLRDPTRAQVIANGRRLVQERYQWDAIATQMRKVFG